MKKKSTMHKFYFKHFALIYQIFVSFIMEGRHLIVSLDFLPPYVIIDKENDKVQLRGYLVELWKILEEKLKFTSEYMVENYSEGAKNILYSRRDVLLRPIIVTSDDKEQYDFTVPVISSWYYLYMKDSDEINSSMSYIRNWSTTLWICTLFMVLIFTFSLCIMLRISNKYLKNIIEAPAHHSQIIEIREYYSDKDKKFYMAGKWRRGKVTQYKRRVKYEESLGHCFLTAIGAFCSQGCCIQTYMTSIRILIFSFLIFAMIMYNAYAALLVSQLTLGERFIPFNSLHEIPEKAPEYSVCIREESYAYYNFKVNITSNELADRWAYVINSKPCINATPTPEIMCSTHVAILESPSVMYESISKNFKCKMTHLKDKYYKVDMSILILKDFVEEGRRALDEQILRLREIGILKHLIKQYIKQDEVISAADDDQQAVTYEHIEGVLIAYASCVGISCVVLIMETLFDIYKHWSRSLERKSNSSTFSIKCWEISVNK